jgi:uncharacterized protein (TIGR03437 family)
LTHVKAWPEASTAGAGKSTRACRDIPETFGAGSELLWQMPRVVLLIGLVAARYVMGADQPVPRDAPAYTAASIVNAADNQSGMLAPYAIGTIYGTNLAYSTAGLNGSDVHGGVLPILLGTSETEVFVNSQPAALFYASPTQINFLIPPQPNTVPGPVTVYVTVDGLHGPIVELTLAPAAPGLFQLDAQNAVATLVDGSVLTPSSPAKPGDVVVLWATGLGDTRPSAEGFQVPTTAAPLVAGANLQILLDGVGVESSAILYAGLAPDNAGLYQINLTLPKSTGANPEIRLVLGSASSIPGVHLPVGP